LFRPWQAAQVLRRRPVRPARFQGEHWFAHIVENSLEATVRVEDVEEVPRAFRPEEANITGTPSQLGAEIRKRGRTARGPPSTVQLFGQALTPVVVSRRRTERLGGGQP